MRLALAVLLGVLAAWRTYHIALDPSDPTDFGQVWFAARALLAGQDPYPLVGPAQAFDFQYRLVYPLTAAVGVIPLAPLPLPWACAVFMALGCGAFAWALMQHGYWSLAGFLGMGMVYATEEAQWSPLFAASLVLPPIGLLFAAKPTLGAAMFAARPSWWAVIGGVVLLAVAFVFQPHWLTAWRHALTSDGPGAPAPYVAIVQLPGGVLALLALLRWRRPEARLVAALACVPQTGGLYDAVPLALVPRSGVEAVSLTALSYGVQWWLSRTAWDGHYPAYLRASGQAIALALYLPCVLMVLRRPNE